VIHEAPPLPRLPQRPPSGHKGTFGTVTVIGGSCTGDQRMIGAPALAANAALRSGVGLVKLLMPAPVIQSGILLAPSATGVALPVHEDGSLIAHRAAEFIDAALGWSQALVIGPGLGTSPGAAAATLRAVQQEDVPIVVDADALTCLAQVPELWRDFHARAVLTPHPGEFRRLAEVFKIPHSPTEESERPQAAAALAQRLGCIVVLKGAGTVVSDGLSVWRCGRGHACLATAGTGDVLAGVIAGLAAQCVRHTPGGLSLFDTARIAVEAHAISAEWWAAARGVQAGMLASELVVELPAVLETFRA
jgi:ADP-dependent NAD(P)H-hydrate dehydratase